MYRIKAYELPEAARDSKGQHIANLLEFQPDEHIRSVLVLGGYDDAEYLVLATKAGIVKKSAMSAFDSNRSAGLIAINLREIEDADGNTHTDEVIAARAVNSDDHLLLVSKNGQSVRFPAADDVLRPMGRVTGGVTGMKFRGDDELLAMDVVRPDTFVFTVTDSGFAKRSTIDEYRLQGRGGLGIKVAKLPNDRGHLVGAAIVEETDEVFVLMEKGKVVRSRVAEVPAKGRDTMGVVFAKPDAKDSIILVNVFQQTEVDDEEETATDSTTAASDTTNAGHEDSDDHDVVSENAQTQE